MNNQEITETAKNLVQKIESGCTDKLSDFLNQIPEKERVEIARQMDAINAENRKTNKLLPDIQIGVGTVNGEARLLDLNVKPGKGSKDLAKDLYDRSKDSMRSLTPGANAYVHVVGDSKDLWGFKDGSAIILDSDTGAEKHLPPRAVRTRK